MSNEMKLTLRLTHQQLMSWIVEENSDDGLLDDQAKYLSVVHKQSDDGHSWHENANIRWSSPYVVKDEMGQDIFVVDITIEPPSEATR